MFEFLTKVATGWYLMLRWFWPSLRTGLNNSIEILIGIYIIRFARRYKG